MVMGKSVSDAVRLSIPDDLAAALAANPKSVRAFAALPPSHQREYVKWIEEAKRTETRQGRAAKAAKMVLVPRRA
jgi:uncharacterized protein YdeI (YjbR/CyaY-like superfamily)